MITATRQLVDEILKKSNANTFEKAIEEWYVSGVSIDEARESSCVCGQDKLCYLYEITNRINGENLFPIGSSCITKFGNSRLNEEIDFYNCIVRINNAINNNTTIIRINNMDNNFFLNFILLPPFI